MKGWLKKIGELVGVGVAVIDMEKKKYLKSRKVYLVFIEIIFEIIFVIIIVGVIRI